MIGTTSLHDVHTVNTSTNLDCDGQSHAFDIDKEEDNYWSEEAQDWYNCPKTPCPNRYTYGPEDLYDASWVTPHPDQVPPPASTPVMSAPQPPPTPQQQPPDPIQMLIASMNQLQQAMTQVVTNQHQHTPELKNTVQTPAPFKGTSSADARRFLAAFTLYAMSAGRAMNSVDAVGRYVARHDAWIRTALSFLQDEVALWATPYMEQVALGQSPFGNNWGTFTAAFKSRFETTDETADAKEALRKLEQGRSTVAEYLAKFKELMGRTGYGAVDLRDWFYDNLASYVKDELVHTARPIGLLDELSAVAIDIDNRIRQRRAEKAREMG